MAETQTDHQTVMDDYAALWNGDYDRLAVLADDVTIVDPSTPDGVVRSRAAFETHLRAVHNAFPDFTLHVEQFVSDGETVMVEWTMRGTLTSPYYGAPPTGEQMEVTGMSTETIRDGQLIESRMYYNQQDANQQLGLTPSQLLRRAPSLVGSKLRGRW